MLRNITLVLTCALAGSLAASATNITVDGICYDVTGSGSNAKAAIIKPLSGVTYAGDIVVPQSVNNNGRDYTVREIKFGAFADCTELTSIQLPDGIDALGNEAFAGCTALTSINLPTAPYTLPASFLKGCTALESIVVPDNFGMLSGNVFEGCTALKEVTLSQTMYLMGANAFKGCTSLEQITLPQAITMLGVNAFEGCTALKNVTFACSPSSIPEKLFAGCTSLSYIEMQGATPAKTISATAFEASFLTDGTVYVPDDAVETYKAAEAWQIFANIKGISEKTVTPVDPVDPGEEFTSLGTGMFFEPWICAVFNTNGLPRMWEVEIQESTTRPGYYRIINPYLGGNCPYFEAGEANNVYINACDPDGVYIETQSLGFCPNYRYGEAFYISSVCGRHLEKGMSTLEEEKEAGNVGHLSENIITIPASALLWMMPLFDDGDFYWCKQNFVLRLPGAKNYSVDVQHYAPGFDRVVTDCSNTGEAYVLVTKSDDVAKLKYVVSYNVVTVDDELSAQVAEVGREIPAGDLVVKADPSFVGRATVYVVGLNDEGKAVCADCAHLDFVNDDALGPWKSIGKTNYEDVIMLCVYDEMSPSYEVQVEESTTTPGLYRLVNAYSQSGYWDKYNQGNIHNHDYNHHVYINATDPDHVFIEPSPMGLAANDGAMMIVSKAKIYLDAGFSKELIDELEDMLGELFGKYCDGLITIPAGAILGAETKYNDGNYYPANEGYEFRVNIPEVDGAAAPVITDTDAETRYYDLQGRPLTNPAAGQLLIEQYGTTARKVIK